MTFCTDTEPSGHRPYVSRPLSTKTHSHPKNDSEGFVSEGKLEPTRRRSSRRTAKVQPWTILVHDCEDLEIRVVGDSNVDWCRRALSGKESRQVAHLGSVRTAICGVVFKAAFVKKKEKKNSSYCP